MKNNLLECKNWPRREVESILKKKNLDEKNMKTKKKKHKQFKITTIKQKTKTMTKTSNTNHKKTYKFIYFAISSHMYY